MTTAPHPAAALPELTESQREECRETETMMPFAKDKVRERIAVIEHAMKRGIAIGLARASDHIVDANKMIASESAQGEALQWVHDRIRRLPPPEDRTEYGRGRFDAFEDVRVELTKLASAPAQAGQAVCPYCSSDNSGVRSTYFDQTCEGCVARMSQAVAPSEARLFSGRTVQQHLADPHGHNMASDLGIVPVESAPQPVGEAVVPKKEAIRMINALISAETLPESSLRLLQSLFDASPAASTAPAVSADERAVGDAAVTFEQWAEREGLRAGKHNAELHYALLAWQAASVAPPPDVSVDERFTLEEIEEAFIADKRIGGKSFDEVRVALAARAALNAKGA